MKRRALLQSAGAFVLAARTETGAVEIETAQDMRYVGFRAFHYQPSWEDIIR